MQNFVKFAELFQNLFITDSHFRHFDESDITMKKKKGKGKRKREKRRVILQYTNALEYLKIVALYQ